MRALDLVKQSGVSYRRLDLLGPLRLRHLPPPQRHRVGLFGVVELALVAAVVTLMGTLTRAGITPAYAETLARDLRATRVGGARWWARHHRLPTES